MKILDHYPLDKACLIGCGVTTGWGSAVYAADVRPGDDVVVIGIGGHRGVRRPGRTAGRCRAHLRHRPGPVQAGDGHQVRCDPHRGLASRRRPPLINEVTWGKNADKVICAMGVGDGRLMESIMQLTAKRGRVVVTNIHPMAETRRQPAR